MREMKAKYAGKCCHCEQPIAAGDAIVYEGECKSVWHPKCWKDRIEKRAELMDPPVPAIAETPITIYAERATAEIMTSAPEKTYVAEQKRIGRIIDRAIDQARGAEIRWSASLQGGR